MVTSLIRSDRLSGQTTESLKNQVCEMVRDRDTDPLAQKVAFHKNELLPYFEELSQRNPFPVVEEQVPVVLGVWTPIWSTIPFHDNLPGRIHDQSYQIFHGNGYYANIARYAPTSDNPLLRSLSNFLGAFDLMVLQRFEVRNNQWCIQNVGIEQAFRRRGVALGIDDAEAWFTKVSDQKLKNAGQLQTPQLKRLDSNTVKKFEKTYLATPQLEHIYVDHDLRLIKTQREAKQRPSYTIAIRRR